MTFGEVEAIKIADLMLFQQTGEHLTDLETIVLQGSWHKKTYADIAQAANFNEDYIRGTIGLELWRKLSEAVGERVEKRNFRTALERCWQKLESGELEQRETVKPSLENVTKSRDIPRPEIENFFYHTLAQPGCLIRIKAPWQMGKTTLMNKGLYYREERRDRIARFSLRLAESSDFASLENFVLWFCLSVTEILGEENKVQQHWQSKLGNNKVKCMTYFEKYLLTAETPLVLALDDLDRIFSYSQIAGEFLGILRTLHEQAKTRPIWQNLRLILVHTEVYDQLQINQSPFNAGTQIKIPDFTPTEVQQVAEKNGLSWTKEQVQKLMNLVGGHPYLVQQAFYYLTQRGLTLDELLNHATDESGLYGNHLRRYRQYLQQHSPDGIEVLKTVVSADSPVEFTTLQEKEQAQKFYNLGLFRFENHKVLMRYPLYQDYFQQLLL
ncbi:AAA-like domain-containing protein [Spirulina sp. CS-785/01]|uniref:AAA-like domain-containing protein n=1 Tax=Spirulina sp. CS-785/01 TaxID=3021716 RepID=UPI00232EC11F|nr:AAA-like domain-containing protein [Spirulina sp. CS-785/01]MDB9315026.1 AAA-like domain-containing protein [Spirulina sp. CS-785/01]